MRRVIRRRVIKRRVIRRRVVRGMSGWQFIHLD
jgi:hypothetical protein